MAKLYFYYGAMTSGKTLDVIQTAYKYNSRGNIAIVVKPAMDTKGDKKIVFKLNNISQKVDVLIRKEESFFDYDDTISGVDCIVADEAQFFTSKQVEELAYISKYANIPVICYGLRTDFQGNLFEGSKRLFELADELIESVAICDCGRKARFNARKIDDKYVLDGEQVFIGTDEFYDPMCESCYFKKVLNRLPQYKDMKQQSQELVKKAEEKEKFFY